jgi:hypothetical protein
VDRTPSQPDDHASPEGMNWRIHDGLTDLHIYALLLESQGERDDEPVQEEVRALRRTITALRAHPAARGGREAATCPGRVTRDRGEPPARPPESGSPPAA